MRSYARGERGRRLVGLGCAAALVTLCAPVASAGTVSGQVKIQTDKLGKPSKTNKGFVDRIENPLKPVRAFNPRPYLIVVLTGGEVDEEHATPPKEAIRWPLVGESFAVPLLPIMVRSSVELRNEGTNSPILYSDDLPEGALKSVPLDPGGLQTFQVDIANKELVIHGRDNPHLTGSIVAFDTPYFATVDADGKWSIPDVPAGRWTVKIWYRNGWLDVDDKQLDVKGKKTTYDPVIPPSFSIKKDN